MGTLGGFTADFNGDRVSRRRVLFEWALFLTIFLNAAAVGGTIDLNWMDNPGYSGSIEMIDAEYGVAIDIVDVAENLNVPFQISEHNERVRFDLPKGYLIFTIGLPYVIVNGQLKQIPLPLSSNPAGFYAPVEPFIELFSNYYPGELYYDPSMKTILASQPSHNILGIRINLQSNLTRVVITANENLKCETQEWENNGVMLSFKGGSVDTEAFNISEPQKGIESIQALVDGEDAVIKIRPVNGIEFHGFEISSDPPLYIVSFASENAEIFDERINSRLKDEKDKWAFDIVVIDPGHGGKDPGAIGASGYYEKNIVLDIGLKLRRELENEGIHTVMTRDKDVFIPLSQRTQIANNTGGKLFLSLHCNACPDSRARGIETYFLSPAKNEDAMRVAMLENSVIKYEESQEQYRDLTEENFILLSMAQANFIRESQDLAAVVQDQVSVKSGLKNRGVDQAGFYVLHGASMPAVLFELGFITNGKDEKRLLDKRFRQEMAEYICGAVIDFLRKNK